MKAKIFLITALLTAGLSAQAQSEQMVEAVSPSKQAELPLQNCPKLVIGTTELTFTDNKNETTFSASERLVIRIKKVKKKGDVNDDGKRSIADVTTLIDMLHGNTPKTSDADVDGDGLVKTSDVTTLVNIVLSQPAEAAAKAKRTVEE